MLKHALIRRALLIVPLLLTTSAAPTFAQRYDQNRGNQGYSGNQNYYNGVRDGGRGGNYDRGRHDHYNNQYDDRYQQQHQGGIGPGKGALIGGGGGAILGALFGGGMKGTIIGGAAGAGVGALVGKVHQNNQRRDSYNGRDNYGDNYNGHR